MSYWQNVQHAAGMSGNYHWALAGSVIATLLLSAAAPRARPRLRATMLFIALAAGGMLICGLLLGRGDATTAGYRWTHFASELLLAVALINLAGVLLFGVLFHAVRFRPAPILYDTLLGLSYIAVALVLLSRHGVDLSGIVATSAVVTAVIGFSLQDTLGNIMGGVALQMERSIAVGDWVRLGDVEGVVREIRWRHTAIETRNWDTVYVPNGMLMKAQVTVLGRREGLPRLHRMWVYFHVDFRWAPTDVTAAVQQTLRSEPIPGVAVDPPPDCILYDFKESFGRYAVRYWLTDLARDDSTSSQVRARVFAALQRGGILASIPAQKIFLAKLGKRRDTRKQRRRQSEREAALQGVALLASLNDAERTEIAGRLTQAPFCAGEVILRQGVQAHHLYIIKRGNAEVCVEASPGQSRVVATLHAGDVCGEIGLMTGEPRSATVTALTDTLCYRLDKEGFAEVLRRRPDIAEGISTLLAHRKLELDAIVAGLNAEALHHRMDETRDDMLHKIRRFFTLT